VVNDSAAPPAALTPEQSGLLRLVYGAQAAQIIYVAAKLGVPDILKDGPRTSASACAGKPVAAPSRSASDPTTGNAAHPASSVLTSERRLIAPGRPGTAR
jgi:hypothetical protein